MKWGRLESPSSHWTIALSKYKYEILLGIVCLAHLFLAYTLPPAEDELYYWTWSQSLSLSYFDHPPMTAWWIYLSTLILGNTLVGIRLPAVLTHFFLLYRLGRISANKTVLIGLLLTPLSLFGAVLMTPDIPLLLFWFLYMNWASEVTTQLQERIPVHFTTWLLGGLWLGLGLLSKYTMGLAPICLLLLLVTRFKLSTWLKGFLVHGILALLVFTPVLKFNFDFAFAPILFQWQHTHNQAPFSFAFDFLGTQILLIGALPFLLIPWLLFSSQSWSGNAVYRSQAFFFFVPLFFFFYKSTHHFLEANWGLVSYLSFWPLSSLFTARNSRPLLVRLTLFLGFLIPLTISILVSIHIFHPLAWVKVHQDRLARLSAQNLIVKRLATENSELKLTPLFLTSYQWTSYFRFHGFSLATQLPNSGRSSHFTLFASDPCAHDKVLFFNQAGETIPQALECFKSRHVLTKLPMLIRGQETPAWELIELSNIEKLK